MAYCSKDLDGEFAIHLFLNDKISFKQFDSKDKISSTRFDSKDNSMTIMIHPADVDPADDIFPSEVNKVVSEAFIQLQTALSAIGDLNSYYVFDCGLIIRKNLVRSKFTITTQSTDFEINLGNRKISLYVDESSRKDFIRSVEKIFGNHPKMAAISDTDRAHSIFVASKRRISKILMADIDVDENDNDIIDVCGELTHICRSGSGQEFIDTLFEYIEKFKEELKPIDESKIILHQGQCHAEWVEYFERRRRYERRCERRYESSAPMKKRAWWKPKIFSTH
jgi:hypothetical protein